MSLEIHETCLMIAGSVASSVCTWTAVLVLYIQTACSLMQVKQTSEYLQWIFISFHVFNIAQFPSAVHSDVDVEIVLIIK
jgi:hypothetical protein